MPKEPTKEPKCDVCGVVIILMLSEPVGASGNLCLKCSGATLGDFLDGVFEEGISEEDYLLDRVETVRIFHGGDR